MRLPAFPSFARAVLGMMLCALAERAVAFDGAFVTAGTGDHVNIVGVGIASPEWARWPLENRGSVLLHGEGGIALWEGGDRNAAHRHVVDFSLYPVWRLETGPSSGLVSYLEASIGANLLSNTRINSGRVFSTAFQFGEFAGAGATFGAKRQYDLGLRVQHVSNADIKTPNDGLTFVTVVFQYRLDTP